MKPRTMKYLEAGDVTPPAFEVVVYPDSLTMPRHYRLRYISHEANTVFYHPEFFKDYIEAITAGKEWIGAKKDG